MDIYYKKRNWKWILIGFAIVIGISSLFVTNVLVRELKIEERKKIELWADATKHLVNLSGEGDYSLAIKVISENNNIPVILVDDCDSILESRNFQMHTKIDSLFIKFKLFSPSEINKKFLRKELSEMKKNGNDPIKVNIIGDTQWIYYKDSSLLNRLRFYPIYQLGFISVFIFIAYSLFNASRKSEQNKVWAGMAKEAAHQLGTPLSSLMAWIELLKSKDQNKMILEMEKDILRLEKITDRFSKIGSKPKLTEINIVKTITDISSYLKNRLPEKINIVLDFEKNEIIAPINEVLLHWVIENIYKNAADAMKGNGAISVSINDKISNVLINISDTGEGINRSNIKTIFNPGITSKKRGWGLGLSLSKRIIEEYHNGTIFVMESEKGKGTTFSIKLPKNNN